MQSGSHFQLQLFPVSIISNGRGGRLGISVTNFHANGIACSLTLNNRSRWHRKHKSLISTPTPPSNSVKAKSSVTHCSISNDLISTGTHTPPSNSVKAKSSVSHCSISVHGSTRQYTVHGISTKYMGKQNLLILGPSPLSAHISCSQVFSLIKIIQ